MELELIDYKGVRNYGLAAGVVIAALWVMLIVVSAFFFESGGYYGVPIISGLYTASLFFIVYRPYRTVGRHTLGDRDIMMESGGEVCRFPVSGLKRISLRYTNCRKHVGKFTAATANYLDFVTAGGDKRRVRTIIAGKKEKQRLKDILQGYRQMGLHVTVHNEVPSKWQEL